MKRINKLMYKSLDSPLSVREQQTLDEALSKSPKLLEDYKTALQIRKNIRIQQAMFSSGFEFRLMQKIKNMPLGYAPISDRILPTYKTATVIGIAAIAAVIVLTLVLQGSFSLNAITGLDAINTDNLTAFLAFEF